MGKSLLAFGIGVLVSGLLVTEMSGSLYPYATDTYERLLNNYIMIGGFIGAAAGILLTLLGVMTYSNGKKKQEIPPTPAS